MEDDKEKLLQQLLESNKPQEHISTSAEQEDFTAYKVLYSGLQQEPEGGLSLSFKSKVFRQIKLEEARKNDTKLYVLAGIVVLIGLIFMAFLVFFYSSIFLKYSDIIVKIAVFSILTLISLTIFNFVEEKYFKLER
jgi:hypothetical protein